MLSNLCVEATYAGKLIRNLTKSRSDESNSKGRMLPINGYKQCDLMSRRCFVSKTLWQGKQVDAPNLSVYNNKSKFFDEIKKFTLDLNSYIISYSNRA